MKKDKLKDGTEVHYYSFWDSEKYIIFLSLVATLLSTILHNIPSQLIIGEFIGAFVGKDIMLPLATFSWKKIKNILTLYDGKKDDLYVTLTAPKTIRIDVYDLSGNFIEQFTSEREVRNKYNMSVAKFKQIVRGNKYYGDHIFIYNTK